MHAPSMTLAVLFTVLAVSAGLAQDADDAPRSTMVRIVVDKDLEVSAFLDTLSELTAQPILYNPNSQRIRGQKMGSTFTRNVPRDRVFDACRAILAFYELSLVPVGPKGFKVYLVVDSRSTNNFIKNKAIPVKYTDLEQYADKDGVYISCAIPVRHVENLTTLRTALSTMVSPAGIGRVHEVPGVKNIIVMDFAPTVVAMARLIREMDVEPEGARWVLTTIELKHAHAGELAGTLRALLDEPQKAPAPGARGRTGYAPKSRRPRIVPYEPRNTLVVSAGERDFEPISELVKRLDLPARQWAASDSPRR